MRTKRADSIEINFHVGSTLFLELSRLQDAGLSTSAIARLAIRKCHDLPLDYEETDSAFPKRLLLYIHHDEARLLDTIANKEGERSRARILRRLISTYLRIKASSINDLF